MPLEKPQQFLPKVSGDEKLDSVQEALAQVTRAQRNQGIQKRIVDAATPNEPPDRGVQLTPNQTIDVPNPTGRSVSSVSVASIIDPRAGAVAAPIAAPNLQVVQLPGDLGKRIVRVRYIPPKKDDGTDIDVPTVRAKLELG